MCSNNNNNYRIIDIEELDKKYEKIKNNVFDKPTIQDAIKLKPMLEELIKNGNKLDDKNFRKLKVEYNCSNKKYSYFIQAFRELVNIGEMSSDFDEQIRGLFRIKNGKSYSGVIVVTVFTSGNPEFTDKNGIRKTQTYSCMWNCSFCPNEPGQPRSYLKLESGVLRANKNNFDCYSQIIDRLNGLYSIGHQIDKLELIISGGTFATYPNEYREEFIRDIFYTANTYWDFNKRIRYSLIEEKQINKTAKVKVIGITIETRPDCITINELKLFRKWEITRVQIGIQHLDQTILDKNNRSCKIEVVKKAIKLLKDNCFKVDIHIMLNLPFSDPNKDRDMLLNNFLALNTPVKQIFKKKTWFDRLFNKNIEPELFEYYDLKDQYIVGDQWKLYPCFIAPWTLIEQWYKSGIYQPYSEEELCNILVDAKSIMFPFIRLNRIIRDFPEKDYSVLPDSNMGSMRNDIKEIMKKRNLSCNCCRCREPRDLPWDGKYMIVIRKYNASDGIEYFISAESYDTKILYGFIRLRIPSEKINEIFEELSFCALIRELHVYGRVETVIDNISKSNIQHHGIGKILMMKAENIAKQNNYYKLAVISGQGVKGYYEKIGYVEDPGIGRFMIKNII